MRWAGHAAIIVLLTLLSQVGVLLYAAALWARPHVPVARTRLGLAGLFVLIYAAAWYPIERVASFTGRAALPCLESGALQASAISCVLHRHYVSPRLHDVATALAGDVDRQFPGTVTRTLDANFPFLDGFPLLPHVSHDDGRKLDIAFYYARTGAYAREALGSPVGYWKFERPRSGERDACAGQAGFLRWDMRWFEPLTRRDLALEPQRTRYALRWLSHEGARRGVGKVFVEPHLAGRLGVQGRIIRFQGCHAARHDDHMHVQLGGRE